MKYQKKTIKRMTDRIVELERMIQSSRMYLENISHKLDKSGTSLNTSICPVLKDILFYEIMSYMS
jgi:uncharacterized coiled-coil protein SlyX